ncbi:MAG TPA: MATE family efflux transporter [Bryobacteraceae bacterium]|jgi:MATE family multidrug resistance protein|nr:MATE family efflux transporter [Bryobacteraceae bacterium]
MEAATHGDSEAFWLTARRLAALAGPVILGELGWMAMSVVDTIMVGGLGPAAIGAIGIGSSVFYAFAIFGVGLLFGLDTLVSQSFGAGNLEDCHHSLMQAIYIALLLAVPLTALFLFLPVTFPMLGIVPSVSGLAGNFLVALSSSTLPLLLYGAFRRYLQGIGQVRPVMFTLISANVINWLFNWLLISGHWGFPALGVIGSGLSTGMARTYMAALLGFFVWRYEHEVNRGSSVLRNILRGPDWVRIWLLLKIGAPAAAQILLEIGAFGVAGVLVGRLNATALAAHQIALNCASVTYMMPLGTASAAAVAVGHAIGRRQPQLARRSGYIAIALASIFMTSAAIAFFMLPVPIIAIFTRDSGVVFIGTRLLAVAACFQLFDGIQTAATGALRGLGETRIPMLVNLGGYWVIGLPIGYLLCFNLHRGVYGVWWGLTISLILIALVVLYEWDKQSRRVARQGRFAA